MKNKKVNLPNEIKVNGISYHLQPRFCNKPGCKCHEGHPHGPYWYAYTADGQKYLGRELPIKIARAWIKREIGLPELRRAYELQNKKVERILNSYRISQDLSFAIKNLMMGEAVDRSDLKALHLLKYAAPRMEFKKTVRETRPRIRSGGTYEGQEEEGGEYD